MTLSQALAQRLPKPAAAEAVALWALAFGCTLLVYLPPPTRPYAKLVATAGFLYLPLVALDRRGEDYREYGVNLRTWRTDLKLFALLFGAVLVTFVPGYWLFGKAIAFLPPEWLHVLTPYHSLPRFHPQLPDRFFEWVIDQTFVVALPEEFFYRGYLQTRLTDAWPQGKKVLGVRMGRAFWLTQVLFMLGHLAIFEVWRLWVFFPAILFGWIRGRTGSVLGGALLHACCNLLVQALDASFY